MSVSASLAKTPPIGIDDLVTWTDEAVTLLDERPDVAQELFTTVLQSAELQDNERGVAFAHAALARAFVRQEARGQALDHARKAASKLGAISDEWELARLYQFIGEALKFAGKSAEALNAYRQAATRFATHKDAANVANCYTALGSLHLSRDQHDQALSALLKACQLTFALNDQHALADNYHKLASVYYEQDLLDQSLAYAHKSLEAAQLASDEVQVANAYNMLGVLNKYMEQYEQALRFYNEALQLRRSNEDAAGEADVQHNIGLIHEVRDQHDLALHHYAQAMALRKEVGDSEGLLRSFAVLGTTHAKLRRYDLAIRYLQRALELAQDHNTKLVEANLYRELSDVHAELGDYEKAFGYHRQFADLRHSIFNESRLSSFAEAQAKHASAQDERRAERYRVRLVQLEKKLATVNRDLDAALTREADVSQQLQSSSLRESEIANLKSQIIRVVSHEFRTPLAIISNASYMLERYEDQMPPAKKLENHGRISTAIGYMKELLDDVCWIDAATTEAVRVQPSTVSLGQIADAMRDQFLDSAENHSRIHVALPDPNVRVVIDDGLVQQILYHLVSNALKFSQPVGTLDHNQNMPVQVTIHYQTNQLLLVIKDQGIGILEHELPRIYELFFRGANAEERRGLGLGLAIVRKLVDVLNGSIRIDSAGEHSGTTALVAIPCRVLT